MAIPSDLTNGGRAYASANSRLIKVDEAKATTNRSLISKKIFNL